MDKLRKVSNPYETPQVKSYTSSELLADLGPALAIYGEEASPNP